jgi:hypothetical protein
MGLVERFKNTRMYMDSYSKELVKLLKIEIGRNRSRLDKKGRPYSNPIDYTGKLRESLEITSRVKEGLINFNIKALSYAQKVDEGLPQSKQPRLEPIIEWIRKKPVRLRDTSGQFVKLTDSKVRGIAYAISRSQTSPREPVGFIDEAIDKSMDKLNKLGNAVSKDVELNLDDIFEKAGYIKKGDSYELKKDD